MLSDKFKYVFNWVYSTHRHLYLWIRNYIWRSTNKLSEELVFDYHYHIYDEEEEDYEALSEDLVFDYDIYDEEEEEDYEALWGEIILPTFDVKEVDEFWAQTEDDIFFPSKPKVLERDAYRARDMLVAEQPEFLDNEAAATMSVEKGKVIDLETLLCGGDGSRRDYLVRIGSDGNGERVQVESLWGKYIIVSCFFVPVVYNDFQAHAIAAASTELELRIDHDKLHGGTKTYTVITVGGEEYDVEFVVVAKMRPRFDNDDDDGKGEGAFNQFISTFTNCLMVPFWDKQGRDYICKSLGFKYGQGGVVLDPFQTVLCNDLSCFYDYGLRHAFPFDDFKKLRYFECFRNHGFFDYRNRCPTPTPSLEVLLDCQLTDTLYKNNKTNNSDGGVEMVSISVLREKIVGLFIYNSQPYSSIDNVHRVHQQCREQSLDLEIVLVYDPRTECYGPKLFQDRINDYLDEHQISWWVLPYNNSVALRLMRSFCIRPFTPLLIVGPCGAYVDPCGLELMTDFGVYAYPFTRKALFEKELKRLGDLTVDLLFEGSEGYLLHRNSGKVHLHDLPRKNVAIYIGHPSGRLKYLKRMLEVYPKIKEVHGSNFEVVFVCLSTDCEEVDELLDMMPLYDVNELLDMMPWYVYPFEPKHSVAVYEKIFRVFEQHNDNETIVSFGEDGRLCSTMADWYFQCYGPSAFPFHGNLREEVKLLLHSSSSECIFVQADQSWMNSL